MFWGVCVCNRMVHVSDSGTSACNLLELWYLNGIQGNKSCHQELPFTIVSYSALTL